MLTLKIALLIAIILYIVVLVYELFLKIKENKSKKTSKAIKDLFGLAILSAITKELDKTLKEDNEKTEKNK